MAREKVGEGESPGREMGWREKCSGKKDGLGEGDGLGEEICLEMEMGWARKMSLRETG